jgi:hypothetical protein
MRKFNDCYVPVWHVIVAGIILLNFANGNTASLRPLHRRHVLIKVAGVKV